MHATRKTRPSPKPILLLILSLLSSQWLLAGERPHDFYGGFSIEAVLDHQRVGEQPARYPEYTERTFAAAVGWKGRSYPGGGNWGIALSVSYLAPLSREVRLDDLRFTSRRAEHERWYGAQLFFGATYRRKLGRNSDNGSRAFAHLDAGSVFSYYYRRAREAQGGHSFRSSRLGTALAVRPGIIVPFGRYFHLGFDTLVGFSVLNVESVERREYEDISYGEAFNGYVVIPSVSIGLSSAGFR